MPAALLLAAFAAVLFSEPAFAYVGPGAGLSMLGALWAVIAAVLLTIGGLLFWPLRAVMRRRRNGRVKAAGNGSRQAADGE